MGQAREVRSFDWKKMWMYLLFGNGIRLRNRTTYLAYIAVLAALGVVFKVFSIEMGIAKLTFTYLPCFLAGIYFGPLVAVSVGATTQIVGGLFTEFPWPLNILSSILMGVIMGASTQFLKMLPMTVRILIGALVVYIFITLGINTYAFTLYMGVPYFEYLYARMLPQGIVLAINTMIVLLLVPTLDPALRKNRS